MIKYAVQYDFYTCMMQFITNFFKIFIGTETAVDLPVIPCIISMGVGFKYW